MLKKQAVVAHANWLNKKVTEGVHREDTLPQIVGNRTNGGLSTWASMRNGSILRQYANTITGLGADKGKILDEFCAVCGYQRKAMMPLSPHKLMSAADQ
jgi:hypothetical protein